MCLTISKCTLVDSSQCYDSGFPYKHRCHLRFISCYCNILFDLSSYVRQITPYVVSRQPRHSVSTCRQSSTTSFHVRLSSVVNHVIPCPSVVTRQPRHSMSVCRQSSTTSFHVRLSSVVNHVIPCPSVISRRPRHSMSVCHQSSTTSFHVRLSSVVNHVIPCPSVISRRPRTSYSRSYILSCC